MLPVYQTIFQSENVDGNCLQACVASLLELDMAEVPNFSSYGDYWFMELVKWGLNKGFLVLTIDGYPPTEVYSIVGGKSPRGDFTHAVVYGPNGNMVHDPHPSGDGLCENEVYWYYLFVPIDPSVI